MCMINDYLYSTNYLSYCCAVIFISCFLYHINLCKTCWNTVFWLYNPMHWVLGQKKQKRKKPVCAVVETFFHFETCECAVLIKETGTLHFLYKTNNGMADVFLHPRQLRRFWILYLIWLYWMNVILQRLCVDGAVSYPQVSSCTPPRINSDIYALHICCVSFTFRILICFNWTLTSHAYCMRYNHLGW